MILIGSQAAKHWFPDFPREPKDIDYVSKEKYKIQGTEFHYSPAFDWLLENEKLIASPNALYTIKLSHSFWDIFWKKTISDIEFFQKKNCQIIEEFYSLLYSDWEKIHSSKKINLNISNEIFFTEYVDRKYKHDDIHWAIKYYDEPFYLKLKNDKSKAFISKNLFNQLTHEDKIKACREEIYVIALERYLIPGITLNKQIAYHKALKDVVTRLSKGWFPRFIIEHWLEFKNLDEHPFTQLLKESEHELQRI